MNWRRRAVLALFAVALVGCSSPGQLSLARPQLLPRRIGGVVYLPAAMSAKEFFTESRRLHLAPGWRWPTHPIPSSRNDLPMFYQVGFGRQDADSFWFCSWAATAIAAPYSAGRQALAELPQIRLLYYYTNALNGSSRIYLDKELYYARHDNLGRLRTDVTLNCPGSAVRHSHPVT
jgi:hypothetical protein